MKVGCALPQSGALASGENLIRSPSAPKSSVTIRCGCLNGCCGRSIRVPLSAVARRKLARQFPERLRPDRNADVRRRAHSQRAIGDERAGCPYHNRSSSRAVSPLSTCCRRGGWKSAAASVGRAMSSRPSARLSSGAARASMNARSPDRHLDARSGEI